MTDAEKADYWKSYARRHESRARTLADAQSQWEADAAELENLRKQTSTEHENSLRAAREEARNEALAEARATFAAELVGAKIQAGLAERHAPASMMSMVDMLDHTKFLTVDGQVDTAKVSAYVDGVAPRTDPDMGQGRRGSNGPSKSVTAGKDLFATTHKKHTNT